MIFTRVFWAQVVERAVKTFIQAVLALLLAGPPVLGVLEVSWLSLLDAAGLAALLSVLTSLASAASPTDGNVATPSLVPQSARPRGPQPPHVPL
jgi:hypothetical protein